MEVTYFRKQDGKPEKTMNAVSQDSQSLALILCIKVFQQRPLDKAHNIMAKGY